MGKEKMRFTKQELVFESDLEINEDGTLFEGYAWATDGLISLTNYKNNLIAALESKGEIYDESASYRNCNISFYPIYNKETEEIWITASYYIFGEYFEERITLNEKEADFVRDEFKDYYCNDLELD